MILTFKRKQKGLTIVEVLVSVVLTSIVCVYGVSFFSAAWRLSVESKDYNTVLNDLVKFVEIGKGYAYLASTANYETSSIANPLNVYTVNKTLRSGVVVGYTYTEYGNSKNIGAKLFRFYGSTEIYCSARWPLSYEANVEKSKSMNRITLKTYKAPLWV